LGILGSCFYVKTTAACQLGGIGIWGEKVGIKNKKEIALIHVKIERKK